MKTGTGKFANEENLCRGKFCVIILALGSVTVNAPCTYAAANSIQAMGRYGEVVPRWIWCIAMTIVEIALSVAGRNVLYQVFENFLPIMAYGFCSWYVGLSLIFH